ncbi:hypothetical protein CsSME_00052053 [Camellia sinensis var. sinensis]
MEEDGEDLTPFWLQSSTNRRRRRSPSSFFLSSGALIFLLCVTAFLFMFFIIPSILSFTTQIFRPNLVKKSWDSINIVLVLFALVFGFLSRNKNYDEDHHQDHQTVSSNVRNEVQKSDSSTVDRWYEYSDHRTVYDSSGVGGLRRTSRASSSYPDLREASPWDAAADDRWRFSDDTQVDAYQHSESDRFRRRRSWKRIEEEEDEGSDRSKTIHVDTLVIRAKEEDSYTPPLRTSPPPPPPPLPAVHRKPKRTYESIAHKEKRKQQVKNESEPTTSAAPPPPPPPRPPSPPSMSSEKKSSKSDRERSGGANVTKDFLTSLYHQSKKKKKQRQKSVDNFESLLQTQSLFQSPPLTLLLPPSPPPHPPPPPPPPSVFQNMFSSKKGKSKKILTIPPPPPPPPPPSKTTIQTAPIAAREPPLPVKISNFNNVEEKSNSGGESPLTGSESPLIRIPPPPPPPPPPFKMPAWRFVVQGDYVRIGSMNSSRSDSSDVEDGESPRSEVSIESGSATTAVDGGEAVAQPLFCPSPDVNTKADMFIAKFRAGLKLQKINSIKRLGLSNLGPETRPEPGPS